MNSLSILLYIIGLVGSFHSGIAFLIFASLIIGLASFVSYLMRADITYPKWTEEKKSQIWNLHIDILKKSMIVFFICFGLKIVIPSEKTISLIAASEISERVIMSKTGQEVGNKILSPTVELLNTFIEKHTTEMKKEIQILKDKK